MSITADNITISPDIVLPNGNVGAMSLEEHSSGLAVVAFAVNGEIDSTRKNMTLDCQAFISNTRGSGVVVAGLFNIANLQNLDVSDKAKNIHMRGVEQTICGFENSLELHKLDASIAIMRTLYLAILFKKINLDNPDTTNRLIDSFSDYSVVFQGDERTNPVVGLMNRYYFN